MRLRVPRAVLFDVGDTLLEERRFDLKAGIAAVVEAPATVVALAGAFRAELAGCHRQGRELLLAGWLRARVPALAAMAAADVEDAIWRAVVTLVPRPGAAEVLRHLADHGVPAAAVSNAAFSGRVLGAELARHDFADGLRFVLSSADVAVRKPAPAIFAAALDRLGVDAAGTWFVGDRLEEDVAGARAAGLEPIWFGGGASAAPADGLATVRDWVEFLALYEGARRGGA